MKSFLKWSAIIVGCLVIVVIAALLIIPMFVDVQKYKPMLETKVSDATGRPFSVGDDLKLTLFPWAGLSFSELNLGNPPGFSEKEFVAVKSFEVRVKILPLLSKDIQIKRFVLNQPRIVLVKNKNGRVNWAQPKKADGPAVAPKEGKSDSPAGGSPFEGLPIKALEVGNFSIKDGTAIWIDHSTDGRREISKINLVMKDVSLERPIQLTFSAFLDEQPLSIEGTVGPLGKGLELGSVPLDLNLKALKQLSMHLKGHIDNPATTPLVDLEIEVAEFSPRKLMAALKQPFPVATADPDALNKVALKAKVKADAKKVALSDGQLNLDDSKLDFSLKAKDFSRPNVSFNLNLDRIDLDRYLPPGEVEKAPGDKKSQPAADQPAAGTQPGKKPTDYKPLRRLVMDGQVKIGQLVVKKAQVQDILLKVTAKDGIINLDPMKLSLYQGNVAGKGSLNVRKKTPRSQVNLKINNVQIGPLLQDVMEKDILEGATQANFVLAMTGDNADLIKKTLTGKGNLIFKDGAIKGVDLANMARNVQGAFGLAEKGAEAEKPRTDFTELKMPFTMKKGIFDTQQTSLKSPFIRIIAVGTADLVQEILNFRVEPKAVGTIKGQGDADQRSGIMVPVLVSGSFAAPKFRPDLDSAAKQKIEKQVTESKEFKKVFEKEELKPHEEKAKGLLKGILNK